MGSVGSAVNQSQSLYEGRYVEGTPSNQERADEVVRGVADVLADFGLSDELRNIYFNETGTLVRGEANASMNGLGDLHISNKYLRNDIKDSKGILQVIHSMALERMKQAMPL